MPAPKNFPDTLNPDTLNPDTLNQDIGVLKRREVEARMLAPLVEALGAKFGREAVVEVIRAAIIEIAQQQGHTLADAMGGCGADAFESSLQYWTQDDALQLDVLQQDPAQLDFNVIRCRYAEMYQALGIPELGAVLSCNRDFALIAGFNPGATLERTQTLMQGASHCDFRYRFPADDVEVRSPA